MRKRKDTDYRRRGLVNSGKKSRKKNPNSVIGGKVSTNQAYYDISTRLGRENAINMLKELNDLCEASLSAKFDFDTRVTESINLYAIEPSLRSLYMYKDVVTFHNILAQIIREVSLTYVNSIKSNYRLVADATAFVTRNDLMANAAFFVDDDSDKIRRAKFAYIYKCVSEALLGPDGFDEKKAIHALNALSSHAKKTSKFLRNILLGRQKTTVDERLVFDMVIRCV